MFKVKDIIDICDGVLLQGDDNLEIVNFCNDTRVLKENDCYVAIKGEVFDGNIFYEDAINKGAKICILETEPEDIEKYNDITFILVKDSVKCLQDLARYKISNFKGKVIAITGSVGKTSTKDMVYSVVNTKYKTLRNIGNLNNHLGLPMTILSHRDEEVMVLEMGMNQFGEISLLTNIAKPDIAIITNIGTAHIGNLGSRENILKAKLEILEGLKETGKLIVNNDNDLLHKYYEENKNDFIISCGIDNESDYVANNIEYNEIGSKFNVLDKELKVNVPSNVFVYNALIAYAVGIELDIPFEKIKEGIENFSLTKNRMSINTNKKGVVVIDDTYNASFDSIKAALNTLGKRKEKRKIAVLGDILELGEFSESIHRSLAKEVIDNNVDILVLVGNDVKYLLEEITDLEYKGDIYMYPKSEDTFELMDEILEKDDVVLLKASNSINLTKVVNYLMN